MPEGNGKTTGETALNVNKSEGSIISNDPSWAERNLEGPGMRRAKELYEMISGFSVGDISYSPGDSPEDYNSFSSALYQARMLYASYLLGHSAGAQLNIMAQSDETKLAPSGLKTLFSTNPFWYLGMIDTFKRLSSPPDLRNPSSWENRSGTPSVLLARSTYDPNAGKFYPYLPLTLINIESVTITSTNQGDFAFNFGNMFSNEMQFLFQAGQGKITQYLGSVVSNMGSGVAEIAEGMHDKAQETEAGAEKWQKEYDAKKAEYGEDSQRLKDWETENKKPSSPGYAMGVEAASTIASFVGDFLYQLGNTIKNPKQIFTMRGPYMWRGSEPLTYQITLNISIPYVFYMGDVTPDDPIPLKVLDPSNRRLYSEVIQEAITRYIWLPFRRLKYLQTRGGLEGFYFYIARPSHLSTEDLSRICPLADLSTNNLGLCFFTIPGSYLTIDVIPDFAESGLIPQSFKVDIKGNDLFYANQPDLNALLNGLAVPRPE